MELQINNKKITNPFAIAALVLFSLIVVGAAIFLVLLIVLPLIGIAVSGVLIVGLAIITPILFWVVFPVLMLSLIAWCFGRILK